MIFVLGNAISSIITNMTIVLSVGSLASAIPVMRTTANRLPILIGSLLLVVLGGIRTFGADLFTSTGRIHTTIGILLLLSLPVYLLTAFRKPSSELQAKKTEPEEQPQASSLVKGIIIIFLSAISVALSAKEISTAEKSHFPIFINFSKKGNTLLFVSGLYPTSPENWPKISKKPTPYINPLMTG